MVNSHNLPAESIRPLQTVLGVTPILTIAGQTIAIKKTQRLYMVTWVFVFRNIRACGETLEVYFILSLYHNTCDFKRLNMSLLQKAMATVDTNLWFHIVIPTIREMVGSQVKKCIYGRTSPGLSNGLSWVHYYRCCVIPSCWWVHMSCFHALQFPWTIPCPWDAEEPRNVTSRVGSCCSPCFVLELHSQPLSVLL